MKTQFGRRVVWPAVNEVAIEGFEIPTPAPDQVSIETLTTLVSPGTERAVLRAEANAVRAFPRYPGYSNIGVVTAIGSAVTKFSIGDTVASYGNHASHVVMAEDAVLRVPPDLPPETAVFFILGTVALQGLRKARLELGEGVLTIGLGIVGQWVTRLAAVSGALPNLGADPSAARRELAHKASAPGGRNYLDAVYDPLAPDFIETWRATHGDGGVPVVIEASGALLAPLTAFQCAAESGRVILLGGARGETQVNFYQDVLRKNLTVRGAHLIMNRPPRESSAGVWDWRQDAEVVLRLLSTQKVQIDDLRSACVNPDEAPTMYQRLLAGDENLIGIVIQWR